MSASAATNLLVDEALRSQEHPLVIFRDGPSGRRARLIGGPDVWEVAQAINSTRNSESGLAPQAIVELVSETSGLSTRLIRAALDYWADHKEEIDGWIGRAQSETEAAELRWQQQQKMLGR
ncbi:MAG: hypothetical protein ACREP9_18440 [Candidatus Dormibacteraceae bacterium]